MQDLPRAFYEAVFLGNYRCDATRAFELILKNKDWWEVSTCPWEILINWEKVGEDLTKEIRAAFFYSKTGSGGRILIHKSAKILPGTYIEGPAIIGPECIVGPNCALRKFVFLDTRVTVGQGAELKSSAVMQGSYLSHFCYLGHSLLGRNCSFSAGVITATSRLDKSSIKVKWKETNFDSGLTKLGAIIGDNVRLGISVSIMPGKTIAPGCHILPNSVIKHDVVCV